MAKRLITLHCDTATANLIIDAVQQYAVTAYPPGGSDCAQVARDALLTASQDYQQQIKNNQYGSISSKQRSLWKTAIRWYIAETQTERFADTDKTIERILGLFKGETINKLE